MEQAPYRQNARPPSDHRPRKRLPLRVSVRGWLGAPRYVTLGLVLTVTCAFGRLNLDAREHREMIAPRVEAVENALGLGAVASVPVLALLLHLAWRRLPAPRGSRSSR